MKTLPPLNPARFLRFVASVLVFSFSLQTLSFADAQFISIPNYFTGFQTLKNHIKFLPELQERQAYVTTVKQNVTAQINSFLAMSQSQKAAFASSLGLSASDLYIRGQIFS